MSEEHHVVGVYQGSGVPHLGIDELAPPPPWRTFDGGPPVPVPDTPWTDSGAAQRARSYEAEPAVVEMVNAALLLRRPLLVTGRPGSGKSSLAHSIAHELQLGPVLRWPIVRASTLKNALYEYDALARMQEANLRHAGYPLLDVGSYIRLGPLGTALLPTAVPRVVLIDDFDQSDFDLPNELLPILEAGEFEIPELVRISASEPSIEVMTADGGRVEVRGGRVRCHAFPMIVFTSSGEREFPPRFLRRCLHLALRPPNHRQIESIVAAHLGSEMLERSRPTIEEFLNRQAQGDVSTDQLLNAVYLATSWGSSDGARLASRLMAPQEAEYNE